MSVRLLLAVASAPLGLPIAGCDDDAPSHDDQTADDPPSQDGGLSTDDSGATATTVDGGQGRSFDAGVPPGTGALPDAGIFMDAQTPPGTTVVDSGATGPQHPPDAGQVDSSRPPAPLEVAPSGPRLTYQIYRFTAPPQTVGTEYADSFELVYPETTVDTDCAIYLLPAFQARSTTTEAQALEAVQQLLPNITGLQLTIGREDRQATSHEGWTYSLLDRQLVVGNLGTRYSVRFMLIPLEQGRLATVLGFYPDPLNNIENCLDEGHVMWPYFVHSLSLPEYAQPEDQTNARLIVGSWIRRTYGSPTWDEYTFGADGSFSWTANSSSSSTPTVLRSGTYTVNDGQLSTFWADGSTSVLFTLEKRPGASDDLLLFQRVAGSVEEAQYIRAD